MAQHVAVRRREPVATQVYTRRRGSIVAGALWMFVISVLLFWLPVLGPLIAGIVGGKGAGGVGAAIAAVFLPAIAISVIFFVLFTAVGFPLIGILASGAAFITIAAAMIGPLLIGAVIGGVMA